MILSAGRGPHGLWRGALEEQARQVVADVGQTGDQAGHGKRQGAGVGEARYAAAKVGEAGDKTTVVLVARAG